jgi:hypothetical protein
LLKISCKFFSEKILKNVPWNELAEFLCVLEIEYFISGQRSRKCVVEKD